MILKANKSKSIKKSMRNLQIISHNLIIVAMNLDLRIHKNDNNKQYCI